MSLHRADSELVRLNASASHGPVSVSEELFRVIRFAQEVSRATDGGFDITIGPVADLWGFIWKQHRMPTEIELEQALAKVGHQHVELDPVHRTVRFTRAGVSVDLGGIAKGYAVDSAIMTLRKHGVADAMVRAGGDLRAIGSQPGQVGWEVQLEDPAHRGKRVAVRLRDESISTAGNYENFFVVDGRRYSHLLQPRTGLPVEGRAACSVRAATCMESDAWSTALLVLGPERSREEFGGTMAFRFTLMPDPADPSRWPVVVSEHWLSSGGVRE